MNKIKKSFFISKHILFFAFLIINFHGITYAMEVEDKVKEVENFLKKVNVPNDKQEEIISHFKNPEAGIPICKIIDNEKVPLRTKLKKILETALLGYPLSEWKKKTKKLWSRLRRETVIYNDEYIDDERCKDANATKLLEQLIKNNKLNLPPILVYKILPSECYPNAGIQTSIINGSYIKSKLFFPQQYLSYRILTNPIIDEQFSDDNATKIKLGHEIAHVEKHIWYPWGCGSYINMLLAKTTLAISGGLASRQALKNSVFKSSLTKPCIHGGASLSGLILASSLKYWFLRREEKKCDLRAIDICKSAEGVKESLSVKSVLGKKYSENNWEILEMKFKIRKKPLEYSWWRSIFGKDTHPSPAARIRYCQRYAKKQGYDKKKSE